MAGAFKPARHRPGIGLGPGDDEAQPAHQPIAAPPRRWTSRPGIRPERRRFAHRTFPHRLEDLPPVRCQRRAAEPHPLALDHGEPGKRCPAGSIECCQKAALGGHRDCGRAIVERGEETADGLVPGPGFEPDGALRQRRQHLLDRHDRRRGGAEAEPVEAGHRQECGSGHALPELAQPRLDIAAEGHDFEIGPEMQRLRRPPDRRGAEPRPPGQRQQRRRDRRDEGVAGILAGQHRRHHQAGRQLGRHVLHRMDGNVDLTGKQRLLDLLGEQPLAANLGERSVALAIAGGGDRDNGDRRRVEPMRLDEGVARRARLDQGERRSAGSDFQDGCWQQR